jgi:DNA-binding CsgD family transcriptional regulator
MSQLAPPISRSMILPFRVMSLLGAASVEAVRGRESSCRNCAAEVGAYAARANVALLDVWVDHVLGLLELSLGNVAVAAWQLSRCAGRAQAAGLLEPSIVRYEPDLVEALLALGHRQEASSVTAGLQVRAHRLPSPWARAVAARCRGLVASDEKFVHHFEVALALHESPCDIFARARTQLCFGERLRRSHRRVDARGHLASAQAAFHELDAAPWAARAARELDATALTARARRDRVEADELTAEEQRVAMLVAHGATIREAATQLFLSPKTIEAHLGRVYRKLRIHNRAQLATKLATERLRLAAS